MFQAEKRGSHKKVEGSHKKQPRPKEGVRGRKQTRRVAHPLTSTEEPRLGPGWALALGPWLAPQPEWQEVT